MNDIENLLIPKKIANKKRFGRNVDGGYVVYEPQIKNCKKLISIGCNNETSFEEDILKYFPKLPQIDIYDGSSECSLASKADNVCFHQKNITNFNEIDNIIDHTTLKVDIKGDEYYLFNEYNQDIIKNIDQLLIEYHFHDSYKKEVWIKILQQINTCFNLIHIHANNNGKINKYGRIPAVIECTYLNKRIADLQEIETEPYPISGLDYPNLPYKQDYILDWWKK